MYYELPDTLIDICDEFAEKVFPTNQDHYKDRNNTTENLKNILSSSKACEYIVYQHLRACNKKCTLPDIKIYKPHEKNYDADLYCYDTNIHIHVKSVSIESAKKYGHSWIVQKNDPIVNNPQNNHWYCFVEFTNMKKIRIIGWLNCTKAIYKPTKLNHSSKLAIYYSDIKHLM
jgi:hypothetical protein